MKILSFIKNALINLIITILIIIAIFSVYLFIQTNVLENSFFTLFGYSFFQVETGSMSGTMEIDDIVIVKLGNTNIQPQDIVTYMEKDYFVTHRVINVENDIITTKGDSNNSPDAPIQRAQVIGEVIYVIKDVKVWKKVFTDQNVLIPVGVTLLLFIVLVTYKEKAGEKNERRAKKNKKNSKETEDE